MDALERLEQLAEIAKGEPAPSVNVVEGVFRRIHARQETSVMPLCVCAALSAAAAVPFFFLAGQAWMALLSWSVWADPVTRLFLEG